MTRVFSPQTAVGQVSSVPSDRSLYHSEAKSGSTFTRWSLISCCQKLATCVEAGSLMPVTHVSPEVLNHLAPACQASPANHCASLAGNAAMYAFGLAACSFLASLRYCDQVVGTVSPYFLNRSVR